MPPKSIITLLCILLIYTAKAQLPVTSGLGLHLDAALGFNNNGPAPATWTDQSGSGNDMVSGTGLQEPAYVANVLSSGFPGIRFDGNDYLLNQTLNSTFSDTGSTLIIVRISANPRGIWSGPYNSIISIAEDSTLANEMNLGSDWGLHHTQRGNWTYLSHPCYDSLPTNKPAILATILGKDIHDIKYLLNGDYTPSTVLTVGSPAAFVSATRRIMIGARFQDNTKSGNINEYFSGHILEAIAYSRKLTTTEMQQVMNYLKAKYLGISSPGVLIGDTVCKGEQAYLTYNDFGGPSSVTVTYSDGTNAYTQPVQNGVPFALTPNPTITTTYTIGTNSATGPCAMVRPSFISATVLVNPVPTANAGKDTSVCANKTILLHGSGGNGYTWYGTGITNANTVTPIVTVSTPGDYILVASNGISCNDTDTVHIAVLPTPTANAGNDTTLCTNIPLQLNGSGGGSYSWSPATVSNPNIPNPTINTSSQTYTLVVTNSAGCTDTDEVTINVFPPPLVSAGNDTTVCGSPTIWLHGSGTGPFYWSCSGGNVTNNTDQHIEVAITSDIDYYLTVTDNIGCTATDTIAIKLLSLPVFNLTPKSSTMCAGASVVLAATGGNIYSWTPSWALSSTSSGTTTATPTQDVTYTVVIEDSICKVSDTLNAGILVKPLPVMQATKSNDIDCANAQAILKASGASAYEWSPSVGMDNPLIPEPVVHPEGAVTYTVTGTTEYSCQDTASVTVYLIDGQSNILIPNAFTPNNDGKNDCYRLKVIGAQSYTLMIYNRWGKEVFVTHDVTDCWDGTYKGQPAEVATYFYYYEMKNNLCEFSGKGSVSLLR